MTEERGIKFEKFSSLSRDRPDCFRNANTLETDAFSFRLIPYELVLGDPGFPLALTQLQRMLKIVPEKTCATVHDLMNPNVTMLIRDCWAHDRNKRPTFWDIIFHTDRMDLQITPGVNHGKFEDLRIQ
jgi:hypothetical protein